MRAAGRVDAVVVGGGPAGALVAAALARAGHETVVLERDPAYRWRARGVFSSPAAVAALRRAGIGDDVLRRAARPIPAMRVETPAGASFRLTYGDGGGPWGSPVGFDRATLDPALLEAAAGAGAAIRRGVRVERVRLADGGATLEIRGPDGPAALAARLVVGADGGRSVVARAAGVARPARVAPRVGLTYHLADPDGSDGVARDARMRLLHDGYVGIAPVPGGRVNVGIVLGPSWAASLAAGGARTVAARIVAAVPPIEGDPAGWRLGEPLEAIEGASPVGHRVAARAGAAWLLAGDAAGFLDPFTGEGLHRAIVSAGLAANAADRWLRGDREALRAYDRAMHRRFAAKDAVSGLVQAFLGRPALFEYAARRLATRERVRATMGLVMGDLVPASRALDPRFLGALLAP